MLNSFSNLSNQEIDNLCKVLQCDRDELSRLFKQCKNYIVKNTVFMIDIYKNITTRKSMLEKQH